MSAVFTIKMLTKSRACADQVELFRSLFGESVNVTEARARKVAGQFDWHFARRFLDEEGKAEYRRVSGPALAEYRRVSGAAWAEYQRVSGAAWAEYGSVRGAAWAEYGSVRGAAWAAAYIATCKRRKVGAA